MHTTSIVALLVVMMGAVESVNYTCHVLAFIKDAGHATRVANCVTAANGAFKAIKACKKSCKPSKAQKALKKPTATYLKCLSLYFKSVATVAKKASTVTALVNACIQTTSDFSQCKIASFVPSSNAKALKKATKADCKWNGNKCANVLTPSATVCPNPRTGSSTTSTTLRASRASRGSRAATTATTAARSTATTAAIAAGSTATTAATATTTTATPSG